MGCRVFKGGIQNEIDFWPKIHIPKGSDLKIEVKIDSESQILALFDNFDKNKYFSLNM